MDLAQYLEGCLLDCCHEPLVLMFAPKIKTALMKLPRPPRSKVLFLTLRVSRETSGRVGRAHPTATGAHPTAGEIASAPSGRWPTSGS
jgi:hypothetical protein